MTGLCLKDSKEVKVAPECGSTEERIGRGRGQKGYRGKNIPD